MSAHGVETCRLPRVRRRWKNAVWCCPKCGKLWTLRYTGSSPHGSSYDGCFWVWWPVPVLPSADGFVVDVYRPVP